MKIAPFALSLLVLFAAYKKYQSDPGSVAVWITVFIGFIILFFAFSGGQKSGRKKGSSWSGSAGFDNDNSSGGSGSDGGGGGD